MSLSLSYVSSRELIVPLKAMIYFDVLGIQSMSTYLPMQVFVP